MPEKLNQNERIRLIEAPAVLSLGDLELFEQCLNNAPLLTTICEGETSLSDLWEDLHMHRICEVEDLPIYDELLLRVRREYPVPINLGFRMNPPA